MLRVEPWNNTLTHSPSAPSGVSVPKYGTVFVGGVAEQSMSVLRADLIARVINPTREKKRGGTVS